MHHYRLKHDPRSSHQQIAKIVRDLNRQPILDVGAAQGIIGQLVHDSGLPIDAVEPNPQWAESAKPFYRNIYNSTIEAADLPRDFYQVIVCGDVLEHTVDPLAVLQRLRTHATADAIFIISLPNIAHIAVRTLLLAGRFPQMQRGILDRTHLHFFTRDTAADLLHRAGLNVQHVSATPLPLSELCPASDGSLWLRSLMRLQSAMVRLWPRMFGYQWIFLAQSAGDPSTT